MTCCHQWCDLCAIRSVLPATALLQWLRRWWRIWQSIWRGRISTRIQAKFSLQSLMQEWREDALTWCLSTFWTIHVAGIYCQTLSRQMGLPYSSFLLLLISFLDQYPCDWRFNTKKQLYAWHTILGQIAGNRATRQVPLFRPWPNLHCWCLRSRRKRTYQFFGNSQEGLKRAP